MSADEAIAHVAAYLRRGAELREAAADEVAEDVVVAARAIAERLRSGGKLLLCGNGGSAADWQHVAAELVCRLTPRTRPGIAAIALTVDSSILTAHANDVSFDSVFHSR